MIQVVLRRTPPSPKRYSAMHIRLTPGLSYIIDSVPRPLITVILVHVIRKFVSRGIQASPLTWSLLYILAYPAITLGKYVVGQLLQETEIRRLHARRPPAVYSRLPFGISITRRLVQTFLHSQMGKSSSSGPFTFLKIVLGEGVGEWQAQYGPIYSFSVLGYYSASFPFQFSRLDKSNCYLDSHH